MIEHAHRSEVYNMLRRNSNNYTLIRMSIRACTFRTASMLVRQIKCDPYMKHKSTIEHALIYLYWRLEGSSCVGCSFWELTSPGWVGESCQALVESRVDQEGVVAVMLLQLIQKNLQLTITYRISHFVAHVIFTCSRQCVMVCCASWVGFSSVGGSSTGRSSSLTATGLMSSVKEEEGRRRKWGWVDVEEGTLAEAINIWP